MLDRETILMINLAAPALPVVEARIEHLKQCLASWHAAGYDISLEANRACVASLNERLRSVEVRYRELMYAITGDSGLAP